MKIKFVIFIIVVITMLWSMIAAENHRRAIAVCIDRGVEHFKDIHQFPYVQEGLVKYLARDVAQARCQRDPTAF